MIRLYIDQTFVVGEGVAIPEGELRYLKTVRRGQGEVCLFNREGQEALGTVDKGTFQISEVRAVSNPDFDLIVAIALPENAIIPAIIRSLSELGARELIFFGGDRTQSAAKRLTISDRLKKLAVEAARQCGRGRPLDLSVRESLDALVFESDREIFFFSEVDEPSSKRDFQSLKKVAAIVGCEGGWSAREFELARDRGFHFVHFKTPILRVETAVIVATFFTLQELSNRLPR